MVHFLLVVLLASATSLPAAEVVQSEMDVVGIVEPFMLPFQQIYNIVEQNTKAQEYAEKMEQRVAESPVSGSNGLFDLVEQLFKPSTTTTTPSPVEIFQSLHPIGRQLRFLKNNLNQTLLENQMRTLKNVAENTTVTEREILEKCGSVEMLVGSGEGEDGPLSKLWRVFFSSLSQINVRRKRQTQQFNFIRPAGLGDVFDKMFGWDSPAALGNPWTPNPFVALFTTPSTAHSFTCNPTTQVSHCKVCQKSVNFHIPNKQMPLTLPSRSPPAPMALPNPFYNPLLPRKSNSLL